jgi:L-rhamnose isomerase
MTCEKKVWGLRSKLMALGDERFSIFLREIFIKALATAMTHAIALDRHHQHPPTTIVRATRWFRG